MAVDSCVYEFAVEILLFSAGSFLYVSADNISCLERSCVVDDPETEVITVFNGHANRNTVNTISPRNLPVRSFVYFMGLTTYII